MQIRLWLLVLVVVMQERMALLAVIGTSMVAMAVDIRDTLRYMILVDDDRVIDNDYRGNSYGASDGDGGVLMMFGSRSC